ncbi:MAG: LamG domain-containing protein [Bryobacteraceae bacterium]
MNLSTRLFLALCIAPLAVAQNGSDILSMNPLGYWPLGGNANDQTSNHNNGTLMNGAFFSSLNLSPGGPAAVVFNAAKSQFITMPATAGSPAFNRSALQPLSAVAWIKTVSQGNGGMGIVGKVDPVANTGWGLLIDNSDSGDPGSSGRLALLFTSGGKETLVVEAPQAINDGAWHLVAATYDGSGKASGVQLYIDGIPVTNPSVDADSISSGSILNSAPLTIGGASDGTSAFDGSISTVAVFGTALTPAQIDQLAVDAAITKAVLGQFAFGGGWYSAVYFTNIGSGQVTFPVTFTADDGSPLNVPSISGSSKMLTLAPGGTAVIEAPNVGPLAQGAVFVRLPPGVTGYGVFRQTIPGLPDQEAVAPLAVSNPVQTMVFDDTSYVTAFALVAGGVGANVTVTATDLDGTTLGTASIMMQPGTKTENLLRSLPGLSGVTGKRGKVQFSSSTGNIVVLGLRANGTALTSIPALPQFQINRFIAQ